MRRRSDAHTQARRGRQNLGELVERPRPAVIVIAASFFALKPFVLQRHLGLVADRPEPVSIPTPQVSANSPRSVNSRCAAPPPRNRYSASKTMRSSQKLQLWSLSFLRTWPRISPSGKFVVWTLA